MFSTDRFLRDHLPKREDLEALLEKHCRRPAHEEAVRKWYARKSIPGEWAFFILAALQREGRLPDLTEYATFKQEGEEDEEACFYDRYWNVFT